MDGLRAAIPVTVVAALCALLVGCQSEAARQMPLRSDERQRRLSDVDIPAGFKYQEDKSWFHADAQQRLANLRYKGSPDMDRTIEFFLDNMPARKWTLDHQGENRGQVVMVFLKGPERCTITMFRDWGTTHITIDLKKTTY